MDREDSSDKMAESTEVGLTTNELERSLVGISFLIAQSEPLHAHCGGQREVARSRMPTSALTFQEKSVEISRGDERTRTAHLETRSSSTKLGSDPNLQKLHYSGH